MCHPHNRWHEEAPSKGIHVNLSQFPLVDLDLVLDLDLDVVVDHFLFVQALRIGPHQ